MIVRMKKITLLTSARHRDAALLILRKIGVLHIQDLKTPASEDIQSLETRLENVNRVLPLLSPEIGEKDAMNPDEAETVVTRLISLLNQKEHHDREIETNLELRRWFERWSAISPASLQTLKEAGVHVHLYVSDKRSFKKIPPDKIVFVAAEDGGTIYFALFSQSPDDRLDFKEEQVPLLEPGEVESNLARLRNEIEKIESSIRESSHLRKDFMVYRQSLEKRLELNRVKYGMGVTGEITYLQGFCPEDEVPEIRNAATQEGWGYIVEEPENPSEVPTLTRNPKWIRIIQPLFNFMGTLPGYAEQDVSLVFLASLSLFYAMLVGDAAYGFIFLLATLFIDRKKKNVPKEFIHLMLLFSTTTIIWGFISGTWFGSPQIARLPFFRIFVIKELDSFGELSQTFMMSLSFLIGVIHLSIARLLAAFKKMNSPTAIGDLGWILILWAVYYIANNVIMRKALPGITVPFLISGIILVAVFANFQKNVLKGFFMTLANLPLSVISSFSDIVSYLRLFAVGFATAIVASNFNDMAMGVGMNSIIGKFFTALILVFGHTLNITLSIMSVLVHGVRLNMLEFSSHAGLEWSGKPYQPFKE